MQAVYPMTQENLDQCVQAFYDTLCTIDPNVRINTEQGPWLAHQVAITVHSQGRKEVYFLNYLNGEWVSYVP